MVELPCPVCGGPYPWLWFRDPVTREFTGCTHDVVFTKPDLPTLRRHEDRLPQDESGAE